MVDKTKHRKPLRAVGLVILALVIVIGLITGLDYRTYKTGGRSMVFGTLDNYNQNQTLRFGSLDLKVTNIATKAYSQPSPPAQTDCSALSNVNPDLPNNGRIHLSFGSPQDVCQSHLDSYNYQLWLYHSQVALTVYFDYSNVSNQPLNLGAYKAKLLANTNLNEGNNADYPDIHPSWCNGLPNSELLKGGTQKGCFTADIDKNYTAPLTLQVKNGSKQKDINLTIK